MREHFSLEVRMSVRPSDIAQAIFDTEPQTVHFSGHGTAIGELCFENESGRLQPVHPDALASLFELTADQVHCVLLNACYSEVQAEAIAEHIDYVIGMQKGISDNAAIAFAVGFYRALASGRSIEDAYKFGVVELKLLSIPEHLTPVLVKKGDVLRTKSTTSQESSTQAVPQSPIHPVEISVDRVWPVPRHYTSAGYNIVLLHPSELDTVRNAFDIIELNQVTVLYRPGLLKPSGLVKELIGPFEVHNVRNGQKASSIYATSTVPEYDPDISMTMAHYAGSLAQ